MSRLTVQTNISYDSKRHRYYVIFHEGSDGHGNRRRHTQTFQTLQEAQAAQQSGGTGRPADAPLRGCTLRTWMTYWLESVIARDRAVTTVYGYRNIIRNHILPALGGIRLDRLSPPRLQTYLANMIDEGLSPNTVCKHYVTLASCLRLAVRMDLLDTNPMDRVDPPKRKAAEYTLYTPTQLRTLFSAVEGTYLELAVKLAAYLGLRRSEICGLKWGCVDLDKGVISIKEVRTQAGGKPVIKPPKSASSVRKLGIEGLNDLRSVLLRERSMCPNSRDPEELVLHNTDGRPLEADRLSFQLNQVVHKYHLPKITMHGLRHSFASVANSQGVGLYDLSRALGHGSVSVTGNIYTHLFDDTQQEMLETVACAIEQGRN